MSKLRRGTRNVEDRGLRARSQHGGLFDRAGIRYSTQCCPRGGSGRKLTLMELCRPEGLLERNARNLGRDSRRSMSLELKDPRAKAA